MKVECLTFEFQGLGVQGSRFTDSIHCSSFGFGLTSLLYFGSYKVMPPPPPCKKHTKNYNGDCRQRLGMRGS